MSDEYNAFLARKAIRAPQRGLAKVPTLAPHLFPFQRETVAFGLRAGSWACFFDTGLGKTAVELEWCRHAAAASTGRALILTPLAVARQIAREGERWGYPIRVIREQSEAGDGINVCNYDRLDHLDLAGFGAIALDESSILKSFSGVTTRRLIEGLKHHPWRMAATATPAPNDHMELGTHAECLGVMQSNEMLSRFFINDTATASQQWRLKRHAVRAFWEWVASWARMAKHPRDLGDEQPGYDLQPLDVRKHQAATLAPVKAAAGALFASAVSATSLHEVKRQTATSRADTAAALIAAEPTERWVVWVDTDYEADAVLTALATHADAVREVRGSHTIAQKEATLAAFEDGACRILVTKASICGWGLNWQHTARLCFVGRSFSYEAWYQAVRRCWRFGQTRPVVAHVIVADGEEQIGRVIDRKAADHATMQTAMAEAMRRAVTQRADVRRAYVATHEGRLPAWLTSSAA